MKSAEVRQRRSVRLLCNGEKGAIKRRAEKEMRKQGGTQLDTLISLLASSVVNRVRLVIFISLLAVYLAYIRVRIRANSVLARQPLELLAHSWHVA